MNDIQKIIKFEADFGKMVHNRKKIPLRELQTRYGRAYTALSAAVTEDADWLADAYLDALDLPFDLADTDGTNELIRQFRAEAERERQPGDLQDQWRAALIDDLDREKFEQILFRRYLRRLEIYAPYWNRHTVERSDGRIYNEIIQMYWHEGKRYWMSEDGKQTFYRFPPTIPVEEWKEQSR